jgi:hypothetical protein
MCIKILKELSAVDYVKLERALVTLSTSLPEPPQWSAIATVEGVFLRQYPTLLDGDRVTALTNLYVTQTQSMLHGIDDGSFSYGITAGSDGIYLVFMLQDKFVLSFHFKSLNSIDSTISAVRNNWSRLLQELE